MPLLLYLRQIRLFTCGQRGESLFSRNLIYPGVRNIQSFAVSAIVPNSTSTPFPSNECGPPSWLK